MENRCPQIAITGHGSQQEALHHSKDNIRAKLSYAASDRKFTIILGMTDVGHPISTKAKWLRKRYIGV